jgi:hypothetical protein
MPVQKTQTSSLVSMAGIVLLALLINGTIGYFGLRYVDLKHVELMQRVNLMTDATDLARDAQVHFKIQVQEWKNLLLRGQETHNLAGYRDAMLAQAGQVQEALRRLGDQSTLLKLDAEAALIAKLNSNHQEVLAVYQKELQSLQPDTFQNALKLDRAVRGIDRPLNDAIDKLALRFKGQAHAQRLAATEQSQKAIETVHRVMMVGTALAVAVLLLMLGMASRRNRDL